jgi:phosphatidylglycerophosphate synthase
VARALLALPLVWTVSVGAPGVALALLALAVLSDVLDGRLARDASRASG